MLSDTRLPYDPRVDWCGFGMPLPQDQGLGVFNTSTTPMYTVNGMTAVGAGISSTGTMIQQATSQPWDKRCIILSCEFRYTSQWQCKEHMRAMHQDAFTCEQCMYVGTSHYELGLHASDTGHASFICKHDDCEKRFSRLDTYQRHERTHREDAKRFPCMHCRKYQGKNGFKRKDHLTQHLRNYHHIGEDKQVGHLRDRKWCPKKECTESRPASVAFWEEGVFRESKEWVKHVRTVHDESEFSCPQAGCDRVNGKGYFRPADLRVHLRKVHGTDGSFDQSIWHNLWQ
ncbi:hypothetical protein BKA58DRAFT_372474 [Alternaria rosae]|uniref:uncharacterized protein n=1 Tax=Alternaria rosae TaxID=1187941 RepID=UPI001E8DD1DD|nr:uncharacterized protein BKA58DRAFT_372474 [Alternaria rosae]KAH6881953.1 hypothetical protein BKA58DRAFT_372474 [Alternaria rosae]